MTLGDYHTCQSYKTVNKWRGWYVSRCHVSWRCCWSTFNSAAEENKWEGKGSHLSNYKQISTALVMLGRLNRVCTGPGHLICKIRLMYVCEALHIYWATCFEIMTLGDLGSENTNWLPAAQQANRHVTAMALGCWFQMLFLSVARAGGSSSTSFPGMIKAGWYGRGTAIWRCYRFAVRCVKHVKLCPLFSQCRFKKLGIWLSSFNLWAFCVRPCPAIWTSILPSNAMK